MGNTAKFETPLQDLPVTRIEEGELKPTFYAINFPNDGEPIFFEPNIRGDRLELVSFRLPLFDNVSGGLSTSTLVYDIGAGDVSATLDDGDYTAGADLIVALNLKTPGLVWVFIPATKRIKVTAAMNFSIKNCRLLNLILGFELDSVDGTTDTYTASQIMNLYPFSHYLLHSDKIVSNSYFAENRLASMVIPVAAFDFVGARAMVFTRDSYYYRALRTYSGNLFPMQILVSVLFVDNSTALIPDEANQKYSITLAVY